MRNLVAPTLTLLVGIAVGALAVNQLQAQGKGPAYVITDFTEITDAAAFAAGSATVAAGITAGGGKILARTNDAIPLDGPAPKRFAIFMFDSVEKAKAWYGSEPMKAGQAARLQHTKSRSFIIEGLPN